MPEVGRLVPAGFGGRGRPASSPSADGVPASAPAPPPAPAAGWRALDRSSRERTSHPQSVLCHRRVAAVQSRRQMVTPTGTRPRAEDGAGAPCDTRLCVRVCACVCVCACVIKVIAMRRFMKRLVRKRHSKIYQTRQSSRGGEPLAADQGTQERFCNFSVL